jgi:hypothetical protein
VTTCVQATDADLILAWPGTVIRTGERWLVVVSAPLAETGTYTITMGGLPFEYGAAVPPDDATAIRNGLLVPLGAQVLASASPQGSTGILLQEVVPPPPSLPVGLGVTVTGPAVDTIAATLISGGDANEAQRLYWLSAVLCDLPPCCLFASCPGDYTRMHAALAAHWIYTTKPQNVGSTGAGANDFEEMRLGPGTLKRGKSVEAQNGQASDAELAQTVPGRFFLFLRRKYIFPFMCA